jgi:hypothetical protein
MAASSDTIVEIPPPEVAPKDRQRWGLPIMFLAMVVGLSVFISVTSPEIPPLDWAPRTGPDGSVNLDSLVATDEGFAILSGMTVDGVLLWSSADAVSWRSRPLQGAPSQLATIEDGLIAYGVRGGRMVSRDGEGWVEVGEDIFFPDEIRSRQGSGRPSLIGGDDGFVALSLYGDVWWSDGDQFDQVVSEPDWGPGSEVELAFDSACRPPTRSSPDVPPMVETDSGLVTMISSNPTEPFGVWPVCEPMVWFSVDGRSWTESAVTLGDGAYVYNLAWRDGRYTAVGGYGIGMPTVWTSTDGSEWDQIEELTSLSGIDLYTVEAGPAGWVILGRDSQGAGSVGWTSLDGLCWTSLPPFVSGGDTAIASEHIVVFDRTTYPDVWVGSITGGSGSC